MIMIMSQAPMYSRLRLLWCAGPPHRQGVSFLFANSYAQVKMARKWQEREGTVEPGQETKTQEKIVEELRTLVKHPAVPTLAAKVAQGSAIVHAVCA